MLTLGIKPGLQQWQARALHLHYLGPKNCYKCYLIYFSDRVLINSEFGVFEDTIFTPYFLNPRENSEWFIDWSRFNIPVNTVKIMPRRCLWICGTLTPTCNWDECQTQILLRASDIKHVSKLLASSPSLSFWQPCHKAPGSPFFQPQMAEPRHEKTCLWDFQPGTNLSLLS